MRRILYALGALVLLIVLAAGALWLARVPLAERYLADRLARAGFPEASFEIESFGWRRLVLAPLALGPGDAPAAERLGVRYRPLQLLRGDLAHVELNLHGLRADVARGGDGLRLAGWPRPAADGRAAPAAPEQATAALGAVPTLHVRDARVTVASPVGRWVAILDADVEGGPEGPASARVDAGIRNNRLVVEGELAARYDGTRVEGSARLRENDGFSIETSGRVVDPLGQPRARLAYTIDMPAAADLPWPFLPGAPPTAGQVTLAGSAHGRIASREIPGAPREWLQALIAGGWQGDYRVDASDLAMTARFDGLDVRATGEWRGADGRLSVATDGKGSVRVERVAEALWSRLSPPAPAVPYLRGPVRVRWQPGDWLHLQAAPANGGLRAVGLPRLRIDWPGRAGEVGVQARAQADLGASGIGGVGISEASVDARGLRLGDTAIARVALVGGVADLLSAPRGELDLSVDLPALERAGVTAADVALRLPMRIESGDAGLRAVLREPGLLRAGELALPGGLQSADGVVADVSAATLRAGEDPGYSTELGLGSLRLEAGADDVPVDTVDIGTSTVRVEGGTGAPTQASVRVSRAEWPQRGLGAAGLQASYRPGSAERWLTFRADRIAPPEAGGRFAPVSLSGRVARRAEGLVIAGEGRAGDGSVPFRITGRAAPGGRTGQVAIDLPTVRFEPEGLQPSALGAALGRFERVDGAVGGSLRLAWQGRDVDGSAIARVDDLDFSIGPARVSGLGGEVRLAGLRPPRTGSSQRLAAEAIDAGVRVAGPTLEFAVEGGGGRRGVIHVIAAEGDVIDGRVAVRDWRFEPFTQVYDPTLAIDDISLAGLLDRLSIDGLAGSGSLSGALPISIAADGVAIRDGRLRGLDGTLQYRSERADEVLADADRSVELMLRALRDFRYEQMEIGVRRELQGESRIDIRMEGSNPDVLDGHPFHFNIALTGDVQPLLDAVARGRELTDELIERHLRMQQQR